MGPTTSQKNLAAISHSSKGNYSESSLPSVRRLFSTVFDEKEVNRKITYWNKRKKIRKSCKKKCPEYTG